MRTFLYAQGTRVRVRRASFPLDAALVDREGLVVELDDYRPRRYGVILDGEDQVRDFAEEELATVEPGSADKGEGDTGPTVGPMPSGGTSGTR